MAIPQWVKTLRKLVQIQCVLYADIVTFCCKFYEIVCVKLQFYKRIAINYHGIICHDVCRCTIVW